MSNSCETKPKTIKEFFRSWYFWKPFIAATIGGIAGFLYYYFIGCSSGTCPMTSNAYVSILWGSLLGFFVVSSPCSSGSCGS